MWQRQTEPEEQTEPEDRRSEGEHRQRSRSVMTVFFLLCALSLLLVSALPVALIPPALSQLLSLGSFCAMIVALFNRDPLFADHLTHWDQAAGFLALSLVAGLFTDTAAVNELLSGLGPEAANAGAIGTGGP